MLAGSRGARRRQKRKRAGEQGSRGAEGRRDNDPSSGYLWKISEGRDAMPSWKGLSEKERWSLVVFLRSLAGKK